MLKTYKIITSYFEGQATLNMSRVYGPAQMLHRWDVVLSLNSFVV